MCAIWGATWIAVLFGTLPFFVFGLGALTLGKRATLSASSLSAYGSRELLGAALVVRGVALALAREHSATPEIIDETVNFRGLRELFLGKR